jgi:hypothetical protein
VVTSSPPRHPVTREAPSSPVAEARVVLRDRSTPDVLDLALRFLARHRVPFAKVGLVVLVPGIAVTWAAAATFGWGLAWLLTIGLGLAAQAPFTELASRLVFERDVRVRDVLRRALGLAPRVLFVRGVQLAAIAVASLFFFVPGLLVAALLFFVGEVVLLERVPFGASLSRLQRLVSGGAGEAALGFLLLLLLHAVCTVMGDVCGRAILTDLLSWTAPEPAWEHGGSLLAACGFWLFLPFAALARFFLYLNVRTRAEGWDIQTRFAAIARRAEAEADADAAGAAPRAVERRVA